MDQTPMSVNSGCGQLLSSTCCWNRPGCTGEMLRKDRLLMFAVKSVHVTQMTNNF